MVIFIGDFVFGVPAAPLEMVVGMLVSAALAALYNFFIFSVDYSRTEYVQFEDDDYYYICKSCSKDDYEYHRCAGKKDQYAQAERKRA